jgi:hypothetical protein
MTNWFRKLFSKQPDYPTLSEAQRAALLESLSATAAYERIAAAIQLGEAREVTAIEGLLVALKADFADRWLAEMQAKTEGEAGSFEAYNAMVLYGETLRAQGDLRTAAAYALGKIALAHSDFTGSITAALIAAYREHQDYYVMVTIRAALESIGTPAALAALRHNDSSRKS